MKKLKASEWFNRIGIFLLLFVGVGMIPLPLMLTIKQTLTWQNWGVIGYYLAYAIIIWIAIYCYHRDGDFKSRKFKLSNLLYIIGGWLFIIALNVILLSMSQAVYHTATSKNQEALQNLMGSNHTIMISMVIGTILFTPIVEETIFRGYLMNAFFKPDSWFLPIIVSGAVFAIAHAQSNAFTFLLYMLMGMTLAFVYKKTGNLKTSILLHGLNNFFAAIGLVITLLH